MTCWCLCDWKVGLPFCFQFLLSSHSAELKASSVNLYSNLQYQKCPSVLVSTLAHQLLALRSATLLRYLTSTAVSLIRVNWWSPGTRIYQSQFLNEIRIQSCNWVSCLEHPHQPTLTTRGCDICSSGKSEECNFKCDGFKSHGIFFLLIL